MPMAMRSRNLRRSASRFRFRRRSRRSARDSMAFSSSSESSSSSLTSSSSTPSSPRSASNFILTRRSLAFCILSRHLARRIKSPLLRTLTSARSVRISSVVAGCAWYTRRRSLSNTTPSVAVLAGSSCTLDSSDSDLSTKSSEFDLPRTTPGERLSMNSSTDDAIDRMPVKASSAYPSRMRILRLPASAFWYLVERTSAAFSEELSVAKTCSGSKRRWSTFLGARKPLHTRYISAETLRDAAGLVASTLAKNWEQTQ
mmetsp:Transcript_8050/g.25733  ORF Transcript_8050/g.25733 Transcript_8050/m.25733 type:complete len:257 (+) Transcript_8050:717-1487(+)